MATGVGRIWRLDERQGTCEAVVQHPDPFPIAPELTRPARDEPIAFAPDGGCLYVADVESRGLWRVRRGGASAGPKSIAPAPAAAGGEAKKPSFTVAGDWPQPTGSSQYNPMGLCVDPAPPHRLFIGVSGDRLHVFDPLSHTVRPLPLVDDRPGQSLWQLTVDRAARTVVGSSVAYVALFTTSMMDSVADAAADATGAALAPLGRVGAATRLVFGVPNGVAVLSCEDDTIGVVPAGAAAVVFVADTDESRIVAVTVPSV